MSSSQENTMHVTVRTVNEETFSVEVPTHGTVADLKRAIAHEHNVAASSQRLLFQGRALDDSQRLTDAAIGNASVVHLVQRAPPSTTTTSTTSSSTSNTHGSGTQQHAGTGTGMFGEFPQPGNTFTFPGGAGAMMTLGGFEMPTAQGNVDPQRMAQQLATQVAQQMTGMYGQGQAPHRQQQQLHQQNQPAEEGQGGTSRGVDGSRGGSDASATGTAAPPPPAIVSALEEIEDRVSELLRDLPMLPRFSAMLESELDELPRQIVSCPRTDPDAFPEELIEDGHVQGGEGGAEDENETALGGRGGHAVLQERKTPAHEEQQKGEDEETKARGSQKAPRQAGADDDDDDEEVEEDDDDDDEDGGVVEGRVETIIHGEETEHAQKKMKLSPSSSQEEPSTATDAGTVTATGDSTTGAVGADTSTHEAAQRRDAVDFNFRVSLRDLVAALRRMPNIMLQFARASLQRPDNLLPLLHVLEHLEDIQADMFTAHQTLVNAIHDHNEEARAAQMHSAATTATAATAAADERGAGRQQQPQPRQQQHQRPGTHATAAMSAGSGPTTARTSQPPEPVNVDLTYPVVLSSSGAETAGQRLRVELVELEAKQARCAAQQRELSVKTTQLRRRRLELLRRARIATSGQLRDQLYAEADGLFNEEQQAADRQLELTEQEYRLERLYNSRLRTLRNMEHVAARRAPLGTTATATTSASSSASPASTSTPAAASRGASHRTAAAVGTPSHPRGAGRATSTRVRGPQQVRVQMGPHGPSVSFSTPTTATPSSAGGLGGAIPPTSTTSTSSSNNASTTATSSEDAAHLDVDPLD